ncbi:MAG: putative membrane protein YdfK [Anaerolineales bacterium]|nr:putative membrane protein YdfK [Anaerolineales bacterium]
MVRLGACKRSFKIKGKPMTGTLLNIAAVLLGGTLGLLFGARIPERFKSTIIAGMGLFIFAMGLQMFLETQNPLIVLGALLTGALLGEWWRIEDGLQNFGAILERRFARDDSADGSARFIRGFLTASLLFCVGPMTILGSIQDGLSGDYKLLAVKSVLDGFAALAFASTLGVGVLFSAIVILVFQGGISLLAVQLSAIATDPMLAELTATGGVILLGLAISSLLEIKKIRAGNFLPALFVAPLIVWILAWFQS